MCQCSGMTSRPQAKAVIRTMAGTAIPDKVSTNMEVKSLSRIACATTELSKSFASCHTAGPIGVMHRSVLVFRDYSPNLPTSTFSEDAFDNEERAKRVV